MQSEKKQIALLPCVVVTRQIDVLKRSKLPKRLAKIISPKIIKPQKGMAQHLNKNSKHNGHKKIGLHKTKQHSRSMYNIIDLSFIFFKLH